MNPEEAPRCATCKHWRRPGDGGTGFHDEPSISKWDRVVDEDEIPMWGWCGLIGLAEHGERVTVTAFTKDASDYRADLHCRADFGCVLHEPTPPADPGVPS